MLVIHVVESLDESYGGPAVSIPELSKTSEDNLTHVFISLSRKGMTSRNELLKKYNCEWIVFNSVGSKKLAFSPGFAKYILSKARNKDQKIIFHIHNLWNFVPFITYVFSRIYGIPYIVSPRGSIFKWSLNQGFLRKWISLKIFQKKMLTSATFLHVTSEQEKNAAIALGVEDKIINLIPNGTDYKEKFSTPIKSQAIELLGLDHNRRYILFMSRVHPKKRIRELLSVWSNIQDKKNFTLIIAGDSADPTYMNDLKDSFKEDVLNGHTLFLGHVGGESKEHVFAASDFFVLPSHTENFGIAVLEAIQRGLPVITTDTTPWEQINETAGIVISYSDENLHSALNTLMSIDRLTLERMGNNARIISAQYDFDHIKGLYRDMYISCSN